MKRLTAEALAVMTLAQMREQARKALARSAAAVRREEAKRALFPSSGCISNGKAPAVRPGLRRSV
jgi:hypothetical protein